MANPLARTLKAIGGSLMARSGRIGILGTTGARTGKARSAPLGYVALADGSVLIGSGSLENRGWTVNLKADPACTFSVKGERRAYRARLVGPEERETVLSELMARMGGFGERAKWGDLFVLEPAG